MTWWWRIVLAFGAALAVAVFTSAPRVAAQASGEQITSFRSNVVVGSDGVVTVTETIAYDFGPNERHGIIRVIPTRFSYDDVKKGYDRVTPLDVVSVSASAGTPAQYKVSENGNDTTIRIGDPDQTITGAHTYTITYRVHGAINGFADHDELNLNITGNEWEVPIGSVAASVQVPGRVTNQACYAGFVGSQLPCDSDTSSGAVARFTQGSLAPGEGLTTVVAFPTGLVPTPTPILEQRWSLQRAFAFRADTVGPAVGGLVLVGAVFGVVAWKVGRDRRYRGSAVDQAFGNPTGEEEVVPLFGRTEVPVEFEPPEHLRPGQVGVLVHEQARPLDVTATIVDLAVRGYLEIVEVPEGGHPDWELQRRKEPDGLKEYERTLYDAIFATDDTVRLSSLRNHFANHLRAAERQLLDDTVAQQWYHRRPDQTARQWRGIGLVITIAGAGLTVLLAAKTSYGLLGIPLVVLGLLLMFGGGRMPHRTAKGHAVFLHALGFKRFIDESEKERARFAEKQNLFSEYLPYAVVFGATRKWARAFAGLNGELPATPWYNGPGVFNLVLFDQTMRSFTVTTSGSLSSVPAASGASGFSGGFSGGGFGGGGGGSW